MLNYIRKRRLKKAIATNKRKHIFKNFNDIESVLILFDASHVDVISKIAGYLKSCGKKVILWTSATPETNPNNIQSLLIDSCKVIDYEEFSKIKIVKDDLLDKYAILSYDTLLDLTIENNIILNYLLAKNSAEFAIGIKESPDKVYDLVYLKEEKTDLYETFLQLKNYLNNIHNG